MGVAPPQSSVADLRRAAVAYVRTRRVTSGAVAMTATVVPRGGLRTTRAVGVAVARVAHLRSSAASAAGHTVHRRAARAARITRVAPGARHAVTVASGTPRRTAVRGRTSQTGHQQNDHYKFRHRSPPARDRSAGQPRFAVPYWTVTEDTACSTKVCKPRRCVGVPLPRAASSPHGRAESRKSFRFWGSSVEAPSSAHPTDTRLRALAGPATAPAPTYL